MNHRTPEFQVERFEHVAATPESVLLRVAGRWVGERRERLPAPTLLVDDGRTVHRLSPLPAPDELSPQAGPEAPSWR
ncbi:MAG: hypothetical protein M3141_08580, partial [Actinomycetota bacterium]|nr:hypothetical protein [Actinomycetota bacterium]